MGRMPKGAELSAAQRLASASMTGHAERMILGLRWPADERAVEQLHAITTDPVIYGLALGNTLGKIGRGGWDHLQPLADLYRAAGADLEVADRQRLWSLAQPGSV